MTSRTVALALVLLASQAAAAPCDVDRRSAGEMSTLSDSFNAARDRGDPAFIDRFHAQPSGEPAFGRRQLEERLRVDTLPRSVRRHGVLPVPQGARGRGLLDVTPGPLWSADDTTDGPDVREIRRRRERSNAAIARHDSAGFAEMLAPNVAIVTSNSVHSDNRDAYVQRMVGQFRSRPDVVYRRTPTEVSVFAPWRMASERGTWTGSWTEPDGKVTIGGSYFAKWRQLNGAWFVESETYVPERCSGSAYCERVP
ncbi:MAG: nuclear transport factor 2 family protein [Gemmatimonadetes bacterium]|nr:nuclear transport factor 2 family protein [Gemmatimonadota bacterium]